jgi:DNA modification methylase
MQQVTATEYEKNIGKTVTIATVDFTLQKPIIPKTGPEAFEVEYTTAFSFPKRGDWATHTLNAKYRGNFAPQIPRNMILRYTDENDTVLDPFCGSGTTMIETKLLKRRGIGVDINKDALLLTWNRLDFSPTKNIELFQGDARNLSKIDNNSIDLVVTHPPYANIIQYTTAKEDLSNYSIAPFLDEIGKVAQELYRVLKPEKYCAILVGDTRIKGMYQSIAYQTMNRFLEAGFTLKEDIIKTQHNCTTTPYWKTLSKKHNFHLIMHEHLFVFKK